MNDLAEKVVVITGASSGLGKRLAEQAAERGAKVAMVARRKNLLDEMEEVLTAKRKVAKSFPGDVTESGSLSGIFSKIRRVFGSVDLLINSAGVVEPIAPLSQVTIEEMHRSLMVNVFGVYQCTREALLQMEKQPAGGTIVNITSGAASRPYFGWSAYCSQKAAVDMFTRTVALETKDKPVRIFAVSPGPFESHMQQAIRSTDEDKFPTREKFIQLYETGRLQTAEKIATQILDVAAAAWPELSGQVVDLRSEQFRMECERHGLLWELG